MSERSTRPIDRAWDDVRLAGAYRQMAESPAPPDLTSVTLTTLAADRNSRVGSGFAWPALRRSRAALSLLGLAATVVLASGLLLSLSSRGGPSASPSQAMDTQGQFHLTFEMPKTDWHVGEAITGQATLSYLGSGGIDIGSSGAGPIGFEFAEVGGSRHMGGISTAELVVRRLDAGAPITSPIKKTVAWSSADPNGAFYQSWFDDPQLHLPAGDWTIAATAGFGTGDFTLSDQHSLRAPILIHVTP
jgi:hypothetical protein